MTSRMGLVLRSLHWLMKQEMLDDDGRDILTDIESELELEEGEADVEREQGKQG